MKKNKLIALFAGLSLAFVGSAALAAPSADTLLVAGYDSDQMAVLYGVSDIDADDAETATLDCTLVGDFVYEVDNGEEVADDATQVGVTGLWSKDKEAEDGKGDQVEFYFEGDDDEEGDSVLYGTDTTDDEDGAEECALTSVKIEPNGNGEINHGTVVSTFAKLLQGGHGCLIRHFAQSDFGKGDYDEVDAESFEVTLQSFETACNKKVKDDSVDDDDDSESQRQEQPSRPGEEGQVRQGRQGQGTRPVEEGPGRRQLERLNPRATESPEPRGSGSQKEAGSPSPPLSVSMPEDFSTGRSASK